MVSLNSLLGIWCFIALRHETLIIILCFFCLSPIFFVSDLAGVDLYLLLEIVRKLLLFSNYCISMMRNSFIAYFYDRFTLRFMRIIFMTLSKVSVAHVHVENFLTLVRPYEVGAAFSYASCFRMK